MYKAMFSGTNGPPSRLQVKGAVPDKAVAVKIPSAAPGQDCVLC